MAAEKDSLPPPQEQSRQPGIESKMTPRPQVELPEYKGSGKLKDKVALITGGDSGIGRAVAVAFAKEGADIAIVYLDEHGDAEETQFLVQEEGRRCLLLAGDVGEEAFCQHAVKQTVQELSGLDILVNNAAEQHPDEEGLKNIDAKQLQRTFQTNIYSMFYLTRAALPHLQEGDSIINTTSVVAYQGSPLLIDYSATKGAIVSFTRSLSQALVSQGIRVNGVAPGPTWTPLIPATFPKDHVKQFGTETPMGRSGEPAEVAPSYVFLASTDSSYITGQFIHANGGDVING
ncbi:SDR family oxidoreductase [Marinithermofilum abyssi]|nr:SDR family oxidoreductase [Marinithermofilum abyssi]